MKSILSIDGGGMKGYIPITVLGMLEDMLGKSCYNTFDLFAGTSIGGILACLLASGHDAKSSRDFFTVDGPAIFGKQQCFGWNGLFRPRYSGVPLQKCLQNRLGEAKLSDAKALVVPAFDVASYEPYFFKSPKPDIDYSLWQVSMATSAAQTYFPGFKLDDMVLWDGGNVANNPAVCAIAEAMKLWPGEPLRILSLSCGSNSATFKPDSLISAGLVHIGVETLNLLFAANDDLPDYILKHVLSTGYYRIVPDGAEDLDIDGADKSDLAKLEDVSIKCTVKSVKTLEAFIAYENKI
jgi:hypothetical protein